MLPASQKLRKFVRSLLTKQGRMAEKLFLVEGEKLCGELLESNFVPRMFFVREPVESAYIDWLAQEIFEKNIDLYSVTGDQFDQLCDTKSPQGILAVAEIPQQKKNFSEENFLVLDSINDPGNMGTIIRTADWFGMQNILVVGNSAEIFSPKSVRATMGSIFRMNVAYEKNPEEILQNYSGEIFGATLDGKIFLDECRPKEKFALVMGSESHGITDEIKKILTTEFLIPGKGKAESLNVGIAAGISLYHFSRFV